MKKPSRERYPKDYAWANYRYYRNSAMNGWYMTRFVRATVTIPNMCFWYRMWKGIESNFTHTMSVREYQNWISSVPF